MSELFDKQSECIKREFEGIFVGFVQAPASPRKGLRWNEIIKKQHVRKNVFDGREEFIRHLWKGHVMDMNELILDTMKVLFV